MLDGAARLEAEAAGVSAELGPGDYAYLPPDAPHRLSSAAGAGLLLFERRYALAAAGGRPQAPLLLSLTSFSPDLRTELAHHTPRHPPLSQHIFCKASALDHAPASFKGSTGRVLSAAAHAQQCAGRSPSGTRPAQTGGAPALQVLHGAADAQPVLPVPGEAFALRKLLPQTGHYDFNVHVMDFRPGEYLNVKEARARAYPNPTIPAGGLRQGAPLAPQCAPAASVAACMRA